jgi:hypothetical protein
MIDWKLALIILGCFIVRDFIIGLSTKKPTRRNRPMTEHEISWIYYAYLVCAGDTKLDDKTRPLLVEGLKELLHNRGYMNL